MAALAAAAAGSHPPAARAAYLVRRAGARCQTSRPAATLSTGNGLTLVLYSKPGCCLCDGLKEKLHAAFALDGPQSLHSVHLEVRNILSNPEWERLYRYEIPVLAKLLPDGTEETLPRFSPRLGVELIHKKIAAALGQ